ncbi:MAG: gamma-glutamylcyclotransferase [Deltaproteobacteria bacterium]|nr:gamma-glutamylcyclotransferase [Deltaproteobacteria bacterium]
MNALALRSPRSRVRSEVRALTLVGGAQLPATSAGDARLARQTQLFFAYGADLCEPLLRRRCPDARVIGRASLGGFGLAFAGASKTWGGATLTLVPNAEARVDGVLYLIRDLSLSDLDRMQGCPRVYERVTVRVADDDDARADAHAYCMRPPLAGGVPNDVYFDLVAREYHRLGIDPEPLLVALDRAASGAPLARGAVR